MSFNIQTCASLKFKGYASLVHSDFTHKYMYILSLPYHIKEIVRERERVWRGTDMHSNITKVRHEKAGEGRAVFSLQK